MAMQHHQPECHAEKFIHCVECQGHSGGLYNQNMAISVVSSKGLVGLQPKLCFVVQNHLSKCPVGKWN